MNEENNNSNLNANKQVNNDLNTSNKPISWSVGKNNNNLNNQEIKANNLTEPVYTMQDSPLFRELNNSNEIINNSANQNNQPVSQPVPQNNNLVEHFQENAKQPQENNTNSLNTQDWMSQQPLSASSLGVDQSAQEETKKVESNNRFFDPDLNKKLDEVQSLQEKEQQEMLQKRNAMKFAKDNENSGINEAELIKKYVGEKFTKITMSVFSFSALLFGMLYLFYRKMYLFGIIFAVIQFGLLMFAPIKIAGFINIGLLLALALSVNYVYMGIVKRRVKKIVKSKKNKGKSQYELEKICKKKGGVSLGKALLLYFIIVGSAGAYALTRIGLDTIKEYGEKFINYIMPKSEMEQDVYKGKLYYNTLYNGEIFEVLVPDEFNNKNGFYIYKIDDNNRCEFQMKELKNFTSAEKFMSQYKDFHKIEKDVETIQVNEIKLLYLEKQDNKGISYIKATDFNNTVVLFDFYEYSSNDNRVCEKYFNEITKSIVKKEE